MRALLAVAVATGLAVLVAGCPEGPECGPGTEEVDGLCVPIADDDDVSGPDDDDASGDDDDGDDDDSGADDDDDASDDDDDATPEDPGPPEFPEIIDVLTISIRTGYGAFDGTDANALSLCLTEDSCFPLNVADVDDFRLGEIDVYSFEGVGLARADVDRVEIRSSDGSDRWTPHCVELRFDGEPVHCNVVAGLELRFGEDGDELASWTDPDGLHNACDTCWTSSLTHGPMLGAVGPDSARVHFRADATRQVAVHLGATGAGPPPVAAWVYPSATRDFTGEVTIDGLVPDTEHRYYLAVDGVPVGEQHTFRTAPPDGAPDDFSIAFGSCSRYDEQPVWEHVAFAAPDLFFFIGDNHYGNTDDRDSLRWYYRWGLERAGRGELAAYTSTLATWDDHDFTGNNTDGTEPGKDVALRVFDEYWANPSAGTDATPGTFFAWRWGDVDFFFLDDRYHRGFDDSILGAEQTQWLVDQLSASTATFKLLLSGSQWTGWGSNDSWASFPEATAALYEHIADEGIDGVVLLSGDVHRSEFRLNPGADGGYDLPEITSSPLANSGSVCGFDSELIECHNGDSYFVTVDVDTTVADPTLIATIWSQLGVELGSWVISHSDLQ